LPRSYLEFVIFFTELDLHRKLLFNAEREELRDWLLSPVPHGQNRSAPLVQMFFAGQLSDDKILTIFERNANLIRQGLAQY
jgi:hypothetical protein